MNRKVGKLKLKEVGQTRGEADNTREEDGQTRHFTPAGNSETQNGGLMFRNKLWSEKDERKGGLRMKEKNNDGKKTLDHPKDNKYSGGTNKLSKDWAVTIGVRSTWIVPQMAAQMIPEAKKENRPDKIKQN